MRKRKTEEVRRNSIVIFVGDRGTGKTTYAVELMLNRNYPAIVLDRMNQDNYDAITTILHDSSRLESWNRKGRLRVYDKDALDNILLKHLDNIVQRIFVISTDKIFGITTKIPTLMSGSKEKILKVVQNFFQDINLTMPIEAMAKITDQDLTIIHKFYGNHAH